MTTTPENLRELAQRGVGFDMNPTMIFTTAESMYSQWLDYFTRLDRAWREQVAAAADALSAPPADDVRDTVDGCPLCWDMESAVCNGYGRGLDVRSQMARAIREASVLNDGSGQFEMSEIEAGYYADAVLAAAAIEVRPRGTVTDAEVEAAVEAFWKADGPTGGPVSMRAALEAAQEARS